MEATLKIRCIGRLSITFNWCSAEADTQPYLTIKSKGSLAVLGPAHDKPSSRAE